MKTMSVHIISRKTLKLEYSNKTIINYGWDAVVGYFKHIVMLGKVILSFSLETVTNGGTIRAKNYPIKSYLTLKRFMRLN